MNLLCIREVIKFNVILDYIKASSNNAGSENIVNCDEKMIISFQFAIYNTR